MMTIGLIKTRLTVWGFAIPAEVFDKMTYGEILSFYRKAKRANSIKVNLENIISSKREVKVEKK
jgi:hypothetical protein